MRANFIAKEVAAFAKAHPWLFGSNLALSLSFPLDDVLVPYLLGIIVMRIEQKRKDWKTPLYWLVGILIGMQVVYTLTYWHDAYLVPALQNFIKIQMLESLTNHYEGRAVDFNTGEVFSRFVKIPIVVVELYQDFKNYMLPYMISFLLTAFLIWKYHHKLGAFILVCIVLIYLLIIFSPRICGRSGLAYEQAQANLDEEADDYLMNLQNVYVNNRESHEMRRLDAFGQVFKQKYSSTMTCVMQTRFIATFFMACIIGCFVIVSTRELKARTMSIGVFVTILTILVQWFGTLGWLVGNMREIVLKWSVISGFSLPKTSAGHTVENSEMAPAGDGGAKDYVIALDRVSYSMSGRPQPILNEVNLNVIKGERIAIVGEIGSGKSTVLKVIDRLINPSGGKVYLWGRDIRNISRDEIRQRIGFVPHPPILFNRSVVDNIKYGVKRDVPHEEIYALVDSLGLVGAFSDTNESNEADLRATLKKMAGKGGRNLSSGQRQMVLALRVMLQDPEILLLDEITSSIDSGTKAKLFGVFEKLFKDKTVIMVTHDPDMLRLATRVVTMKDGQVF